jgi:hypothetical protein
VRPATLRPRKRVAALAGDQHHEGVPFNTQIAIREAHEDDWPQIWPIIHEVVTEQQTFAYDPDMSEDDAKRDWLLPHRRG